MWVDIKVKLVQVQDKSRNKTLSKCQQALARIYRQGNLTWPWNIGFSFSFFLMKTSILMKLDKGMDAKKASYKRLYTS